MLFEKGILNGDVIENFTLDQFSDDAVYEVIRLIHGKALFLKEHVERLNLSLKARGIIEEISESDIRFLIHQLMQVERLDNHNVKLLIWKNDEKVENLIFYNPTYYPEEKLYETGIHTVVVDLERKDPNVKAVNTSFVDQIAMIKEKKGAFECLLVNDGLVKEGSRSNLFFFKDGTFYTADGSQVLVGITRMKIIEAIYGLGYNLEECHIKAEDIRSFQGAFISGTSLGVLPIDTIDEKVFGSSDIKAIKDLRVAYEKIIVKDINGGKE